MERSTDGNELPAQPEEKGAVGMEAPKDPQDLASGLRSHLFLRPLPTYFMLSSHQTQPLLPQQITCDLLKTHCLLLSQGSRAFRSLYRKGPSTSMYLDNTYISFKAQLILTASGRLS